MELALGVHRAQPQWTYRSCSVETRRTRGKQPERPGWRAWPRRGRCLCFRDVWAHKTRVDDLGSGPEAAGTSSAGLSGLGDDEEESNNNNNS